MKKILIFSHAMEIGGAERALLGLLESIDTTKYQVDLFLMRHEGGLMKYIPKKINLLPENPKYVAMMSSNKQVLKMGLFDVLLARLYGKYKAKRKVKQLGYKNNYEIAIEYSHKYTYKILPKICNTVYDVAISFLTPHYYVANKVSAKKKIAWIHTDYKTIQLDRESEFKMWNKYDSIVSISKAVSDSFISTFSEFKERIVEIGNIMPLSIMIEQADENVILPKDFDKSISLLSIGRFCDAKNFDNIPLICKYIIDQGLDIKWYLIGYGIDEQLIKDRILEFGMQDRVIILGKKENPYPYIKACDIYVQPSRYEGKCVSVIEAQILHKPVVITNYATSASQLKDGYDGVIVPMDNEGCANGIVEVIRDKDLQKALVENTKNQDYANMSEVEKLYKIIG